MKIHSVTHNNRRKAFQVKTSKKSFEFPYSRVDPNRAPPIQSVDCPSTGNWAVKVLPMCWFPARKELSTVSKCWSKTRIPAICGMRSCTS